MGGFADSLGKYRNSPNVLEAQRVMINTTSVTALLASLPRRIEYMSVDTEGSEVLRSTVATLVMNVNCHNCAQFEILSAFSEHFDKHWVGVITVEHFVVLRTR